MYKMTVKRARKVRDALLLGGGIVMLSAYIWEPAFYVGMAAAVSCLIPHFLWNGCPHCGKQLGRNEGDFCQFCGKRIEEPF